MLTSWKNEKEVCSYLVRAWRDSQGAFAYKIPDVPRSQRFTPPKPFDITAIVNGRGLGVEVKFQKKLQAFGLRHLEPSQVKALEDVERAGGMAMVILGARVGRGDSRLYFWSWPEFKRVPSRLLKELLAAPNFVRADEGGAEARTLINFVTKPSIDRAA